MSTKADKIKAVNDLQNEVREMATKLDLLFNGKRCLLVCNVLALALGVGLDDIKTHEEADPSPSDENDVMRDGFPHLISELRELRVVLSAIDVGLRCGDAKVYPEVKIQ